MTEPSRETDAAPTARARCPRCGAQLGRLSDAPRDAGWYCGCCGLVLPDAPPAR